MTWDDGEVTINGETSVTSFKETGKCFGCSDPIIATIDITLSRKFKLFTAHFGLDDRSRADKEVRYEAIADGKRIYDRTFALGESEHVRLNVAGVLRLRLAFTGQLRLENVIAAVGDPTAFA